MWASTVVASQGVIGIVCYTGKKQELKWMLVHQKLK
jgi:hypothetical protein